MTVVLYPNFTALDVVGPYQVLSQAPNVDITFCAKDRGVVYDDNGLLGIHVEHTLEDVSHPDVLVAPGGFGTQALIDADDPVIGWIADAHLTSSCTTSVGLGSLLLGAAGLLHGLAATTHWAATDRLERYGAGLAEDRVVQTDRIWTAAGVSAGIDLALALVAEIETPDVARAIQLGIEYDPHPPFDAGAQSRVSAAERALVRGIFDATEAAVSACAGALGMTAGPSSSREHPTTTLGTWRLSRLARPDVRLVCARIVRRRADVPRRHAP